MHTFPPPTDVDRELAGEIPWTDLWVPRSSDLNWGYRNRVLTLVFLGFCFVMLR